MNAALRTASWGCLLAMVSACAGPAVTPNTRANGEVNVAMSSWKGRPVYEAVAMWGMPDSITREGALGMLRWKADAAAIGNKSWGQPFSGQGGESDADPRRKDWPMRCARVLSVDIQEVVQHANWSRSEGCSTDPADYLPPR